MPATVRDTSRPTVLHGKFATYLNWSQPFIHDLITGLAPRVRNVVLCNRTENLDRFPTETIRCIDRRCLREPFHALLAAQEIQRDLRPDLLHAHFGWSAMRMLLLKLFLGIPLVTTFGGRDATAQLQMPRYARLYSVVLQASDALICVSADIHQRLLDAGTDPARTVLIRRGTDLQRFARIDRAQRPPDQPIDVLMVGRLVEKKGHRYALQAIRHALDKGVDLRLTIVGDGEERESLETLREALGLGSRVHIEAPMDQEAVRQHMGAADVFLHCSVTGSDGDMEGLPNVVVEAAATGLPVVATRHGGIGEVVRHGETGLLGAEGDVDFLVNALLELGTNAERRLEMGRRSRVLVERDFDSRSQSDRHVEIYRRLVDEHRVCADRTGAPWAPEDLEQRIREALRPSAVESEEFSVSELIRELLARPHEVALQAGDPRGAVARLYERRLVIPSGTRARVKRLLHRPLMAALDLRDHIDARRGRPVRGRWTGEGTNQLLVRYFRSGGDIGDLLPASAPCSFSEQRTWIQEELSRRARNETLD